MDDTCNYLINKFTDFADVGELPEGLKVSTMTITCRFNVCFNITNIGRYISLSEKNIISIKYTPPPVDGISSGTCIRTVEKHKIKKDKKDDKKKKNFYNQATVKINCGENKPPNIKLFKNGSIQMTGCKSVRECVHALTTICRELNKVKVLYNGTNFIKKPFITDFDGNSTVMKVRDVLNLKVNMINSNFKIGFTVDREKLYIALLKQAIDCRYEPCAHACVNIKHVCNNEIISIFVFESGSIIITGAKNKEHIMSAYRFIVIKLYESFYDVVKHDIENTSVYS